MKTDTTSVYGVVALSAAAVLSIAQSTGAVEISDDPLIAATRADPNVMVLLDNGGTMGEAAQEVADSPANQYDPDASYIASCPDTARLPANRIESSTGSGGNFEYTGYDDGAPIGPLRYDAADVTESRFYPVWTNDHDGLSDRNAQVSEAFAAGDILAVSKIGKYVSDMIDNPDAKKSLKISGEVSFRDGKRFRIGPYSLFHPKTNPAGKCFYDSEMHGSGGDDTWWYQFSYFINDTKPAVTDIVSTRTESIGNYLNWYFDPDTSEDGAGRPWGGQHSSKPGLRTRFSVVQDAFDAVIDELVAEGIRIRVGAAAIVLVDKDTPQGGMIVAGLNELSSAHAQTLKDRIRTLAPEANRPGGLYQSLYDVGGYFATADKSALLTLHPRDGDPLPKEKKSVEAVFPNERSMHKILPNTSGAAKKHVELGGTERTYPVYLDGSDRPTVSDQAMIASCQQNFALVMTAGDVEETAGKFDSLFLAPLTTYDPSALTLNPDTLEENESATLKASDRLRNVAVALSDVDLRPDWPDALNRVSTYLVGFKDRTWNSRDIDEMLPVAEQTGGKAYTISNFDTLVASIKSALTDIVTKSAVATGATVSSRRLNSDTKAFRVEFHSGDWSGDVKAFQVNASGDTAGDVDTSAGNEVWSAAAELDKLLASGGGHGSRLIATTKSGLGIRFRYSSIGSDQKADLETGGDAALGEARLEYVRGSSASTGTGAGDFRVRTGALGDIVGSTPVYIGKPKKGSNKNRSGALYVGANDGMFHGFFGETGKSIFSFVPAGLSVPELVADGGGLHRLTKQDYGANHRFFVDMSPVAAEVPFSSGGGTQYKTVVIGGLGAGGKGLFALDVTDPDGIGSESAAANAVLWERFSSHYSSACSASATGYDDLGYVLGGPVVAPLNSDAYGLIFSGGYNGCASGKTALFIANVSDGTVIRKLYVDSDSLSPPAVVDLDGDGTADRAYAGDLDGRIWAFDLSADAASGWRVAFSDKPLFTAGVNRPITAAPAVVRHPSHGGPGPNTLVLFGTGQYLSQSDITDKSAQAFYGIWDHGQGNLNEADLLKQEFDEVADPAGGTRSLRTFGGSAQVDWTNQSGWYVPLVEKGGSSTGERVVTKPTPIGMNVFFNTLIPNADLCGSGGTGWLMAINLEHGGNPEKPAFDLDGDGEIDEANDTVADGSDRVSPAGESYDAAVPWRSNFLVSEEGIQETVDSDGNFDDKVIATINTAGRMSWRELFDE